jgi:hypothetical protein
MRSIESGAGADGGGLTESALAAAERLRARGEAITPVAVRREMRLKGKGGYQRAYRALERLKKSGRLAAGGGADAEAPAAGDRRPAAGPQGYLVAIEKPASRDYEVEVIATCYELLAGLGPDGRDRVRRYLEDRFGSDAAGSDRIEVRP